MAAGNDEEFYCRPEIIRDVLDTMAAGLFVTDAEGEVVCWNNAAERITGFSADEMGGRLWRRTSGTTAGRGAHEGKRG